MMDMILCDWTRMGRTYCLAGAVFSAGLDLRSAGAAHAPGSGPQRRLVAVPAGRSLPLGNVRAVGATTPPPEPPHVEDRWVRSLRRWALATPAERRAVLLAGTRPCGKPFWRPVFPLGDGEPGSGDGERSLVTVVVDRRSLSFTGVTRQGRAGPDYRATLDVPGLGTRRLPVVDHGLLRTAEVAGTELPTQGARD